MPVLQADELRELARRIVTAMGAPPEEARLTADGLVNANLAGHDSHGVIRLEQYAKLVQTGEIVVGAPLEVVQESPGTALIDGGWNFGQVVADRAVQVAVRKARENGTATVSVAPSSSTGLNAAFSTSCPRSAAVRFFPGTSAPSRCSSFTRNGRSV